MFKQKKRGFTLIELLVVIAIIGFLLSAATYAYQVARMKSRDAVRANDIRVLQNALANYLNNSSSYPISSGECLVNSSGVGKTLLNSETYAKFLKILFGRTLSLVQQPMDKPVEQLIIFVIIIPATDPFII